MPDIGYTQSHSHKKKRAKAIAGSKNPAYKDGRRSYRKIAGAKDGDVVHHKDGDRKNNSPSNLERLTDGKPVAGRKTTPKHEAMEKRRCDDSAYWDSFFEGLK